MNIIRILLVFFLLLTSFTTRVNACSCAEPLSVEESLEEAAAVFRGKVKSVKEKRQKHGFYAKVVHFEVIMSWKGVEHSKIIIETGLGDADCGVNFIEGEEYLVYAYEDEGKLSTNICTRTNTLSYAQDDLTLLGEGTTPENEENTFSEQKSFLDIFPIILVIILGIVIGMMSRKRN